MKLRLPRSRRTRIALLAIPLVLAAAWLLAPAFVTLPPGLLENPNASPVVTDRHGTPISRLTLPDFSRSQPVSADTLPADLVACTIAAEDKRFHSHHGIDFLATARALRDLIAERHIISGASTITQQLIKISSPPSDRIPARKLYEALAARKLERRWTKQQILTAYLNRLDYGNLRIGAAEAARFYFQKPLADLSLAESALLAGLPQAPSWHNPVRHPDRAIARRNVVLHRLAKTGTTDPARIQAALAEPLQLRPLRETRSAPWLAALTGRATPAPTAATIPTTLDLPLQRDLESIVTEETTRLREKNVRHAAVVVIHNPTGEILALVSSADWHDSRGGQFNGALVPRSPGSALKPFTYLLAIGRNHRSPASIIADIPTPFRTLEGLDLPQNYDHRYRGPVTLRRALACSLNVPAMRELNSLGGPAPLHRFLTRLGLTTLGPDPNAYGLGLTIGNAPVRLLELTNAYATLARHGRHFPPVLFPPSPDDPAPATDPVQLPYRASTWFLIADILADPDARAPAFPPGGPLDLPFRCAVKTGTSSDFRDNWCLGFTPDFTVGVWAGNFENQPMKGISGVDGAGPVFRRTMLRLHRDHQPTWFPRPAGITEITIDPRTGHLLPDPPNSPHATRDIAESKHLPPAASATDYAPDGKALVPPSYAAWFHSTQNQRHSELALESTAIAAEPLKIITPAEGATFLLDPEIPSGSGTLRPVTNLPGTARWTCPTLRIEPAKPEPVIHLTPGTHTLTATDPRNGRSRHITFHVETL
ncbi:MAG: transglycosylase domain-containing protein [Verrucomicrobiota bacterium JB025]|nr:transglycosylase domain-containing protein [Verrucomicrobiota bacterium JB025]